MASTLQSGSINYDLDPKSYGKSATSLLALAGGQGEKALGQGQQQTQAGVNATAPVLDLLTKLVKGDQGDITQATQPEIDQITQQFDAIRNMISLQPRGGGKTTALAEAPFQKAGAIQRMQGAARTGAAGELGTIGMNLAGLGLSEQGIGAGLEGQALSTATGLRAQEMAGNKTLAEQFKDWTSNAEGVGGLISAVKYLL